MDLENRQLQARIDGASASESKGAAALALAAANLRTQQAEKQGLISTLAQASGGAGHGFSAILVALARQHQPGIVLTRIEVADDGARFSLQGNASEARIVPQYLARLGLEEAFAGMAFDKLVLSEVGDRTRFEVRGLALTGDGS